MATLQHTGRSSDDDFSSPRHSGATSDRAAADAAGDVSMEPAAAHESEGHGSIEASTGAHRASVLAMVAGTMLQGDGDSAAGPPAPSIDTDNSDASSDLTRSSDSRIMPSNYICPCCECIGRCGYCSRPIRVLRAAHHGSTGTVPPSEFR